MIYFLSLAEESCLIRALWNTVAPSVQLVLNRRSMALELKLSCWNNRFVIRGDGVTLHQSVFCFRACFATQVMYEYNNCKHPATVENFPGLFLHILVLRKIGILVLFAWLEISFHHISQKVSTLRHKLLHKLYINVAIANIFMHC